MVNESNCKDYTKLKILRQERGMTQAQLAEAIGVEQKTISNIETGRFSPSMHTLEGLAKVFFPQTPSELTDFFKSAGVEESAENEDFSLESRILKMCEENGTVSPHFVPVLTALLETDRKGTANYAISSMLGGFGKVGVAVKSTGLLSEVAHLIQKAVRVQDSAETENLWHDLIVRMGHYTTHSKLTDTSQNEAKAIVGTLREARFYDDDIKKISILRRCFFFLYDNLTLLADDNHYYDVLSDIVIILADVEFCVSERRHLFYTCLQCAEQMSIDYRRKGGETE